MNIFVYNVSPGFKDLQSRKSTGFLSVPVSDDVTRAARVKFSEADRNVDADGDGSEEESDRGEGRDERNGRIVFAGEEERESRREVEGQTERRTRKRAIKEKAEPTEEEKEAALQKLVEDETKGFDSRVSGSVGKLREGQLERWKSAILKYIEDSKELAVKEEQVI